MNPYSSLRSTEASRTHFDLKRRSNLRSSCYAKSVEGVNKVFRDLDPETWTSCNETFYALCCLENATKNAILLRKCHAADETSRRHEADSIATEFLRFGRTSPLSFRGGVDLFYAFHALLSVSVLHRPVLKVL